MRSILTEANVRNTDSIDNYLEDFWIRQRAGGDEIEPVKLFFRKVVKRWIINNEEMLQPTIHVSPNEPEWVHTAFREGTLRDFAPTRELHERLTHIVMASIDIAKDRPQLLLRFPRLSVEGVENLISSYYSKRMGNQDIVLHDGEQEIIRYPDRSYWVRLLSPEALTREGQEMGHCVGGYGNKLDTKGNLFFSFRDANGRSHITVHAHAKELREVKGKQNQPPVSKYMSYLLDFLNQVGFERSCSDLDSYDLIPTKALDGKTVWKRFDPRAVAEEHEVKGDFGSFSLFFRRGKITVEDHKNGEMITINARYCNFDPSIPIEVYTYAVNNFGLMFGPQFRLHALHHYSDDLKGAVEQFKIMEPRANWQYAEAKGTQYAVRGNRTETDYVRVNPIYLFKTTDGQVYDSSAHISGPPEHLLFMAAKMGYKINPEQRIVLLGKMTPKMAEKMKKVIRASSGLDSLNLYDPLVKHLPSDLKLPKTLRIGATCTIKKLPSGLTIGRDLILKDTSIEALGENTHVKRALRLSGSKVTRLPKGLKVGGSTTDAGTLDLRNSLIKSIPEDTQIIPRPARNTAWWLNQGQKESKIIIAPDQKIRIPEHLKKYVVVRKPRSD